MKERVQKLMAQANIASRRAAEEMIREGRVKVNGQVITIGDKADPATDTIIVDGERLKFSIIKRYIAYNKPVNVLSSPASDRNDERQTVREMIPLDGHLFTIGRLDAESDGLIVLTDDGELANQLMHPRYEHTKTYKVTVYGSPSQETLDRWEHGIFLEEGRTAPCSIRVQGKEAETTTLRIVMIEGKNRQIRRVAALMGHPVRKLTRTHIGQLALGTLRWGEWVELTPEDVEAMKTPATDLSYIKRLKREIRALRGKGFAAAARQEESFTDIPRPSTFRPRPSRPDAQRPSTGRPVSRTRPARPDNRKDYASDDDRPRPARPGQRPARSGNREKFTSDDRPRAPRPGQRPARPGSGRQEEFASDDRPRSSRPGQRPARSGNREAFVSDDDRPRAPRPGQRPARPGSGRQEEFASDDRPRAPRPGQRPARSGNREAFVSDDDRPRAPRPGQRPARSGNREAFVSDDDRPRAPRPGQRPPRRDGDSGDERDERDRPNPRKPSAPRPGTGTGSGNNRGKPASSPRSSGGGSGGSGNNRGKPASSPRSGGGSSGKPKPGGKGKPGGNRPSNRPASKRRKP